MNLTLARKHYHSDEQIIRPVLRIVAALVSYISLIRRPVLSLSDFHFWPIGLWWQIRMDRSRFLGYISDHYDVGHHSGWMCLGGLLADT
jgi:hypothetical protein